MNPNTTHETWHPNESPTYFQEAIARVQESIRAQTHARSRDVGPGATGTPASDTLDLEEQATRTGQIRASARLLREHCPHCLDPVQVRRDTEGRLRLLDAHARPSPEAGTWMLLPTEAVVRAPQGTIHTYRLHHCEEGEHA